jgi:cell division protein ZapA
MAQVTVKINGFAYTMGCEDGQEQHLLAMAEQVETRIDSIKRIGGNTGEARLLVLSALLMADEIHDLRIELDSLRSITQRSAKRDPKDKDSKSADPELSRKLGRLALRAEEIAEGLERP